MFKAAEFLLGHHSIYRGFRRITGSERVNREFIEKYVRPREGESILDVGCGPADVVELMPQVRYTGIDWSSSYLAAARRRFHQRATFLVGDVKDLERKGLGNYDAVISMGVIHHLSDDEAVAMLRSVHALLKPGGRFVSYDPCFTEPQHPLARWIHKHDRGRFVRFDRQYEELISQVFRAYRRYVRTDLCTVPATVIIFECDSSSPAA